MSTAQHTGWTLAEFLAWEERQERPFEFDGFAPVAMRGGTQAQEVIVGNIRVALANCLHAGSCRVWGPTSKILVAGSVRYPDAFVSCQPIEPGSTTVRDPVVVFEVLSPGTSFTDRFAKLREYRGTLSIQRYVILEQDRVAATVLTRRGPDWVVTVHTGEEWLAMPEIGVELPLAECYAGLDLPEDEPSDGR